MTISNNYLPLRQLGNGSTVDFSANWNALSASWLSVNFEDVVTGVLTPQPSGWTAVVADSGFTVTFNVAPPNTVYVVIGREVDLTQIEPYTTSKGFQGAVLEAALDKLTAMIQDQQDSLSRSLKFQLGSSSIGFLPAPIADAALVWDGTTGDVKNGPSVGDIANAASNAAIASAAAAAAVAAANSINFRWCGTATGTANAIVLTPATPLVAYPGALLSFVIALANTTEAVTADVSGLGPVNIKKNNRGTKTNLSIGEWQIGMPALMQFDGTDLVLINTNLDVKGADVASAATLNFSAAAQTGANYFNVTGTTTITAITIPLGRRVTLRHTGAHQITNSGTLVLLGGADIITAAGDTSEWVYDGVATRMIRYERIAGSRSAFIGMRTRVSLTANESIANTTLTIIPWDVADVNELSAWVIGTPSRLTVPAGVSKVRISSNLAFQTNGTGNRRIENIQGGSAVGGQLYIDLAAVGGTQTSLNGSSAVLPVSPGDYFELRVFQSSGGALDIVSFTGTWFEMECLA